MIRKISVTISTLCLIAIGLTLLFCIPSVRESLAQPLNMPEEYSQDDIILAEEYGLTAGLNKSVKYSNATTKLQYSRLLINLIEKITQKELTPAGEDVLSDTDDTAALKAYTAGISIGRVFSPDDMLTYERADVMTYRAVLYIERITGIKHLSDNTDVSMFLDSAEISDWARDAIGIMKNSNLVWYDDMCYPQDTIEVQESIGKALSIYISIHHMSEDVWKWYLRD